MNPEEARRFLPLFARTSATAGDPLLPSHRREILFDRFKKRYGLALILLFAWAASIMLSCCVTGTIVHKNTERETAERVRQEMLGNMHRYTEEQEQARMAAGLLTGEASLQAAMDAEADAIARAVGPMATKRMKQSMIWNILVRVSSPDYPNSVQEVVDQPQQWMFYNPENPVRDDDRALALEQLRLWHEGRWPASLSASMVYAEWSQNDYVLRDSWEKNSSTNYWRMPE